MSIIKAGRSAIAGALSFAMLMAAPVQTFADEVADYTCAEEATLDLDSADMYAFKIIKQGSSGTAVREIQRRLSELGYFNNPITGNFGSITKQAVTAFQIKCGLIADGIPVRKGMKSGDVDPRGNVENCYTVSDKATAVGGGVLEAILHLSGALLED